MADRPILTNITGKATLDPTTYNGNNQELEESYDSLIGRGGTSESNNSMTGNLDMDGNSVINLPPPTINTAATNKEYVDSVTAVGDGDNTQVKVSVDDTTAGFLEDKVTATGLLTATTINPGANETVQISTTAEVNRDLANQAEAEAGTDNVKGMTSLRTAQAITSQTAFRGALVYITSSQTITQGIATAVNFNAEEYDTDTFHDNSTNNTRLTIPTGVSRVKIIGQGALTSVDDGVTSNVEIYKNGVFIPNVRPIQDTVQGATLATIINITSPVLSVSSGDFFELFVFHNSVGSTTTITALTWLALEVIE